VERLGCANNSNLITRNGRQSLAECVRRRSKNCKEKVENCREEVEICREKVVKVETNSHTLDDHSQMVSINRCLYLQDMIAAE